MALWSGWAGKSALAHTICELLQHSYRGVYGGSFFFAGGNTDRGNADKLFATLAYELAIHFPAMRKEINDALANDPSLPTKSMEVQLFYLIVRPILRCQTLLSQNPVLVIDGLDECAEVDGSTQSEIIALTAKYTIEYNLPLRFLFASRPEWWIRGAFEAPSLTSTTLLSLSLRDDQDADKDIKKYLIDGFNKIRVQNKRIMGSVVSPWPSTAVLDHLVFEASGQYIYASTVLKFVGKSSRHCDPQGQLRIITTSGPHRASAFSDLDALYAKILSAYPQWPIMKRILAAHLLCDFYKIPTLTIRTLLGISQNDYLLVLDALSALIEINNFEPRSPFHSVGPSTLTPAQLLGNQYDDCAILSFCHRSFGEFLQDRSRSGSFHIDLDSDPVPGEILNEVLRIIHRNRDQNHQVAPFRYM